MDPVEKQPFEAAARNEQALRETWTESGGPACLTTISHEVHFKTAIFHKLCKLQEISVVG